VSVATAVFLAIGVVFLDDVLSVFAAGSPNLADVRSQPVLHNARDAREV
jgi:hypothetical protein